MPFPRVIPHSDGAGVIDAVGPGVDDQRLGQRVCCYGAQSYRPFGTAAEYSVVLRARPITADADLDILDQAGCLGIAGITAYRVLFANGPIGGLNVLVYGAAGGVGTIATQMAARGGARGSASRSSAQEDTVRASGARHVFLAEDHHEVTIGIRNNMEVRE